MSYGVDASIALGFQNSWDNPITAVGSLYFIPIISENVGQSTEQLISENMRGIFDEGNSYEGNKSADGELNAEAQPISLGWLLKGLMGSPTSTLVTSAYSHLYKPRTSDFDGYSANDPITYYKDMGDGGSATLFYNMNIANMEFTIANNEFLKVKAGFVGGAFQQIEAVASSFETSKRWTWDVASVSIGGAGSTDIEELTIAFDEKITSKYALSGDKWPVRLKRDGMRSYSISGTVVFRNQTEYQKFLNATEQAFIITLTGDVQVGDTGQYETLTFTLPDVRYTEFKPEIGGAGEVTVSLAGTCKYDTTSSTTAFVTLVNTQAVY